MLILAGVSLNAIIGDNGVLTQAQNAKITSAKTSIKEEIETEFLRYNTDSVIDGDNVSAGLIIKKLIEKGIIDSAMESNGKFSTNTAKLAVIPLTKADGSWDGEFEYVVKKGDFVFSVYQDIDGTYTAKDSDIVVGEGATGGDVTSGTTLVTTETFTEDDTEETDNNNRGRYTITGNASVIFADKLDGSYSIYVKSGANATVSIFKDITLSNANLERSAIDIEPGGTLNLWIAAGATVKVDSGNGGYSVPATSSNFRADEGVIGGNGAFAGIHVPKYDVETTIKRVQIDKETGDIKRDENGKAIFTSVKYEIGTATLNLLGKGTIKCYGGDAGDGGNGGYNNLDWGAGARRRSWSWNRRKRRKWCSWYE